MKRYYKLYTARKGVWNTYLTWFPSHAATAEVNGKLIANTMGLTGDFILINEWDGQIVEFSI